MRLKAWRLAFILTIAFIAAGVAAGAWLGFGQVRGAASGLDRLEYVTLDWRFLLAGARPAPGDVVIVVIDDRTIAELEGHALSRQALARIVRAIAEHHPRAVALDIAFPDAKGVDEDSALAQALKLTKSVVASIGIFARGDGAPARPQLAERSLAPAPSEVLWPTEAIRDAAETGLANVSTDASGIPRYIPLIFETPDGVAPSLALAAAAAAAGAEPVFTPDRVAVGENSIATDLGYHLPIRYYGPAGSFQRHSAASVLRGELEPGWASNKVVVVGMTAAGFGDAFATPFDRVAPGAEIFATAIANLLTGETLARTPMTRRIDAATAAFLPAAMIGLMAMRRAATGLAVAALMFALWAAAVFFAFVHGYWLSLALPAAIAAPLTLAYASARLLLERQAGRRAEAQTATLAKFQSPALVDRILRDPKFLEKPVSQDMAVMFLDLSRSTEVSEALGPERARDLLAGMQTLVEREIVAHDGVVINYMGDGVLAAFGLPKSQADDAARALATVERLRESVAAWIAGAPPVARDRLDFRIGLHFGPAVVSRLGSPTHQQITAAGDTVNVASRLLEVAKQQGCRIVVSEDVIGAARASMTPAALDLSAYAPMTLPIRGRTAALEVRIRS